MATIYHQVRMNAPTTKLYKAISTANGIARWWDKPTGTEIEVGSVIEFDLGPEHGVLKMKVLKQRPGKRVEWKCVSRHPKTSPASAWTGTHITFEISESEPLSFEITKRKHLAVLDFRHSRWDKKNKYFGFCNFGWGEALLKLKKLCEPRQASTRKARAPRPIDLDVKPAKTADEPKQEPMIASA